MNRFTKFANLQPNQEDFEFFLDLSEFQPFTGSGRFDPGNFEFEIDGMKITVKKSGGFNVTMLSHSVGPAGFAGVTNVRVMPAPDPSHPSGGTGGNMLEQIAWAIAVHGYKSGDKDVSLDQLRAKAKDDQGNETSAKRLTAKWYKGKRFYASVTDDEYTDERGHKRTSSKINLYLTPEQYHAAPGPSRTGVGAGSSTSPTQDVVPDIGGPAPANGVGAKPVAAPASVDAMLGLT